LDSVCHGPKCSSSLIIVAAGSSLASSVFGTDYGIEDHCQMQEIAVDPGCQFLLLIYDETIQAGSYEWPAHHSLAAVALNYYAFYLFRGYWSNYHA